VEGFEQGGHQIGGDSDGDDPNGNDGAGDAKNNDGEDDDLLDDLSKNMDIDKTAGGKFQTPTKQSTQGGAKTVGGHMQESGQITHLYTKGVDCRSREMATNLEQGVVITEQDLSEVRMENEKEIELGKAYQVLKDIVSSNGSPAGVGVNKAEKMEKRIEIELEGFTEKDRTPEVIAHWYTRDMTEDTLDERDSEQKSRWEEFKRAGSSIEVGASLLQSMELLKNGSEASDKEVEELLELDVVVVEEITKARSLEVQVAEKKKKSRTSPWGPILVERLRRSSNNEVSILQKAMNLKKKINLENPRGNSFAALRVDELNKVARNVNVKIGNDKEESCMIINNLVGSENRVYEEFVGENLEVLLPSNMDLEKVMISYTLKVVEGQGVDKTPLGSFKELDASELWTEVVKKGRNILKIKKLKNE
jgi:hypothetical protein